jgi:thioredoxin 1
MKNVTAAEFQNEVIGASGRVLVDFYTEQCGPCRALAPVLAEMETESAGALKVVKVNAVDEVSLASSFRVQNVPTLLLFQNGQCLGQLTGLRSKKDLQRWVAET